MALEAYATGLFNNLTQHLVLNLNQGVDQMLTDSGIDTMNVQDFHRLIVKADSGSEDYAKEMEELQKKLDALERQKEAEKQAALEEARKKREEDERRQKEQQRNYFRRRWDDIVDDVEHPDHIPSNIGKDFEDTVDTLEEDEEAVQRFVRVVPDRSRQIWQKLMVMKWIINMWTVGIPWCFVLFFIFMWNIYVNIFWNKFWAGGNLYLMFNTFFIIFQASVSIPLFFEIPPILRWMKPLRFLSLFAAIVYTIFFIASVGDFFYMADIEDKDLLDSQSQGWGDLFMSLMIFFNLVENFPILIINWGIMVKEFTLPFWQLIGNKRAPTYKDRIQLSLFDLEDAFFFFANISNPAYTSRYLFKFILGWDPLDMVIENKDDEEHYYTGKAIHEVKHYTGYE